MITVWSRIGGAGAGGGGCCVLLLCRRHCRRRRRQILGLVVLVCCIHDENSLLCGMDVVLVDCRCAFVDRFFGLGMLEN